MFTSCYQWICLIIISQIHTLFQELTKTLDEILGKDYLEVFLLTLTVLSLKSVSDFEPFAVLLI